MNARFLMFVLASALLVAPLAIAQTPVVSIDLDRNTAGIQSTIAGTAGGTIQGEVFVTGNGTVTVVQGFDVRVLSTAGGMASVTTASATAGTTNSSSVAGNYFGRKWLNLDAEAKIDLPGALFTFDIVLPNPLPAEPIALSFPTSAARVQQGINIDLLNSTNLAFGTGELDSPSSSVTTTVVEDTPTPTATTPPVDTPTDTPVLETTYTPTDTPVDTATDTPVDTPTDTPVTETPTAEDTPVDTVTDTPVPETATATNTPTNTPTETPIPSAPIGYIILDVYGGQHLHGTAIDLLPNAPNEYFPFFAAAIRDATGDIIGWSAWETAADLAMLPNGTDRYELTTHGIVWSVIKDATSIEDWTMTDFSTTSGKFVKLAPNGTGAGAYVLDRFGYVTAYGTGCNPALLGLATSVPLPGGLITDPTEEALRALDIEVNAADDTIYVLDSNGGVHIKGANAEAQSALASVYFGWDVARDLEFFNASENYCVLDGFGGLHPVGAELPSQFSTMPYWGWDIARDIEFTDDFQSAYMLDGLGPVHMRGNASYIPGLWFGWDAAIDLELYQK